MQDSYTYNLGFIFGDNAFCIIVCHSHEPINRQHVNVVASEYLRIGTQSKQNVQEIVDYIINGIRKECDIQAVLVNADTACLVFAAPQQMTE